MSRPDMSDAIGALVDEAIARYGVDASYEGRGSKAPCIFETDHYLGRMSVSRSPHMSEGEDRVRFVMKPSAAFKDGLPSARLKKQLDALVSSLSMLERRKASLTALGYEAAPAWSYRAQPLLRHLAGVAGVDLDAGVQESVQMGAAPTEGHWCVLNDLDEARQSPIDILLHGAKTIGDVLISEISLRDGVSISARRKGTVVLIGSASAGDTMINASRDVTLAAIVRHPLLDAMGHLRVTRIRNTGLGLAIDLADSMMPLADPPPGVSVNWREQDDDRG